MADANTFQSFVEMGRLIQLNYTTNEPQLFPMWDSSMYASVCGAIYAVVAFALSDREINCVI